MTERNEYRTLRLRHGISLRELAQAAGVSAQLISAIELEEGRWTPGNKEMLQRAFAAVAVRRREQLDALEKDLERYGTQEFEPAKENDNGC